MLHVAFESTPVGTVPVQPFNALAPVYWEAGAIGMLDINGNGVVSDGASGAYGILADRRGAVVNISSELFVTSSVGNYGDESLFNQPGHGNALFGTNISTGNQVINNVLPSNTVATTSLLRDETSANLIDRYITMYTRGGSFSTDQIDYTQNYVPGQILYVMQDGSGRMTNQKPASNSLAVAIVRELLSGNNMLPIKSTLI